MNNMEIKQGDRVRVSKDIPQFYRRYNSYRVFEVEHQVVDIEDGLALLDSIPSKYVTTIPTKYLVKVDAEAKEAKIKLGDMVRVKGNLHEPFCLDADLHLEITNIPPHAVSQKEWKVIRVEKRRDCAGHIYTLNRDDSFIHNIPEDCIELVEPTAPTIKVGDRVRNIESGVIGVVDKIVYGNIVWVNGVDGKRYHWKSDELELVLPTEQTEADKKPNVGSIKIPVEVDLTDSYWDTYAADLAKELALKVANKYTDPKEAAEYAVLVAKAVVEGLKRK